MERLFRRVNVRVAGGLTVETRSLLGKKMKRIQLHTEDLSIEGARVTLPGSHSFKPGLPVALDLGAEHNTLAIVVGCDPGKGTTTVRLRFVDPGQAFLSQLVPIMKSPGVSDHDVNDWSGL